MSESGRESAELDDSEYSYEDSSEDSVFTDNIHTSDDDSYSDTASEGVPEQIVSIRQRRPVVDPAEIVDEFGEVVIIKKTKVKDEPQNYAPDRWPPIIDFIFVFSSFFAAAVAAYFTIF
jgi:hypothetical protein